MMNSFSSRVVIASDAVCRTAERQAAVAMAEELSEGQRMTLGAEKAYDTADFV